MESGACLSSRRLCGPCFVPDTGWAPGARARAKAGRPLMCGRPGGPTSEGLRAAGIHVSKFLDVITPARRPSSSLHDPWKSCVHLQILMPPPVVSGTRPLPAAVALPSGGKAAPELRPPPLLPHPSPLPHPRPAGHKTATQPGLAGLGSALIGQPGHMTQHPWTAGLTGSWRSPGGRSHLPGR